MGLRSLWVLEKAIVGLIVYPEISPERCGELNRIFASPTHRLRMVWKVGVGK